MKRSIADSIYLRTGLAVRRKNLAADRDAQVAIAALLARVAGGDGSETAEETVAAVTLLKRRFALHGTEALELFSRARDAYADRATSDVLADLDRRLGMPEKEDLLLMLLDLIAADGSRKPQELDVFAESAEALHVPDKITERAFSAYFAAAHRR